MILTVDPLETSDYVRKYHRRLYKITVWLDCYSTVTAITCKCIWTMEKSCSLCERCAKSNEWFFNNEDNRRKTLVKRIWCDYRLYYWMNLNNFNTLVGRIGCECAILLNQNYSPPCVICSRFHILRAKLLCRCKIVYLIASIKRVWKTY